jgi:hypothetical protein
MNWQILASIVAQYGIPVAEAIYKKWAAGTVPTQADFDEFRALASQTSADRLKAQLVLAGIPLDDPKAIELLKLVQS